jgi:hypothetical protein
LTLDQNYRYGIDLSINPEVKGFFEIVVFLVKFYHIPLSLECIVVNGILRTLFLVIDGVVMVLICLCLRGDAMRREEDL